MASPLSAIDVERLEASRYVSAAGLMILVWDHVLTFPDEVQLIWKARLSIPKALFLFNRYMVPFVMIVQTHEFGGTTPYLSLPLCVDRCDNVGRKSSDALFSPSCKAWTAAAVVVGMLSIATSNFLILLRLWVLWDRSPRLVLGTLSFFVVTQIVALSLTGYVIREMLPTMIIDPVLRICVTMTKPKFVLLWIPGIAFELMVFLTTVWNALDQPRNTRMAEIMYRDGSVYFFGLFVLRVTNIMLSVVAPASLVTLGIFFIWSVSNITLARLILNLRRLSSNTGDESEDELLPDDTKKSVEQMELPVWRS